MCVHNCAEYIWNYLFYQDGSIEVEIRLSGILQVYVGADGEPSKYGTYVAPNMNAHNHQHLFSFRLDPMIDGINNSLVESDIMPLADAPTGSAQNFAGNAFISKDTVIETECGRPYDHAKERRWRIVNPSKTHYCSGQNVGYSLGLKGGITPVMARDDGWVLKRAGVLKYPVWVCRDVEDEEGAKGSRMWPAGKYVPQTRGNPPDSIPEWIKGGKGVKDEDILVYLNVGK
jgi:primary-amine oxidase